jgi:hypothetical protein
MPRPRSESEAERLRTQLDELQKRLRDVEAREKAKKARDDMRRWVLTGQAVLARLEAEPETQFAATAFGLINAHARSAADRALFNLKPLGKEKHGGAADAASSQV